MLANAPLDLAALVRARKPNHTLDGAFYTRKEVFDADMDLIFSRHWIFVANEPEIPEAGDYVKIDIGLQSVIIMRDDDMAWRRSTMSAAIAGHG